MHTLINLLAFVAVVVMNYLANALPLNGKTPGQISDQFPNLFVPAGLTFSVWGVIYLLLTIWVLGQVYALLNKHWASQIYPHIERVGWWFAVSCLCNIAWLFAWHWGQLTISLILMVGLLFTLVRLNLSIENGINATSKWEKRLGHVVFGIYQGWITVALVANVTTVLVGNGWRGGPIDEKIWTIGVCLVAFAIALWMVIKRNIPWHGVVVAWAFYGIYLKRSMIGDAQSVQYLAAGLAGVLLITSLLQLRAWVRF